MPQAGERLFMLLTCKQCGKTFDRIPSLVRNNAHYFCSIKCASTWQDQKIVVPCDWCGNLVSKSPVRFRNSKNHFCNSKCWAAFLSESRKVYKVCPTCEKQFISKHKRDIYCSHDCFGAAHSGENAGNYKHGNGYRGYTKNFKNISGKIRARDKYMCRVCGANKNKSGRDLSLDVHHIDHNTYNNKKSNLITLCRSCHRRETQCKPADRQAWEDIFKRIVSGEDIGKVG